MTVITWLPSLADNKRVEGSDALPTTPQKNNPNAVRAARLTGVNCLQILSAQIEARIDPTLPMSAPSPKALFARHASLPTAPSGPLLLQTGSTPPN